MSRSFSGYSSKALLIAVAALAVAAVGCGSDEDATSGASAIDDEVAAIVDDLNAYWEANDDELGFDYEPVPYDRITTGDDGVVCDRQEIDPAEVEDNAFVDAGCAEGILVAYDPDYVGTSLARAEATLAHEWGHVIQFQATEIDLSLDPDGLPIDAELQADCLAGAWAAERAEADIERLRADVAAAGDPAEVGVDDPHAHGTAEERTAAFDIGLDGGPVACIDALMAALPG